MADAKIILFNSPSKQLQDGTYPVVLRITHDRKRKYLSLGRHCLPDQWNNETCRFRKNYPEHRKENDLLLSLENKASDILRDFVRDGLPFSFKTFKARFLNKEGNAGLEAYFTLWIDKFLKEGKIGTASPYTTTRNVILEFCRTSPGYDDKGLKLTDVTYKFLIDFEHWLRAERSVKDTTISVYMRTLRAILNKAIREKLIKRDLYPFDEYRLSERLKTQTPKRAITKEAVRTIEALDLEAGSALQFARDIFLFSYYTRGMNFADIAYLTPENISDGRVNYIRRKTRKPFSIKLLAPAQEILDYYLQNNPNKGPYIFPIFDDSIHKTGTQKYHRRKTALRAYNADLKKLAEMAGLENSNLTSYVSRHTYATVQKKAGTNISLISEALGHQSERVTQIYLKQFEHTELDEIDENVL